MKTRKTPENKRLSALQRYHKNKYEQLITIEEYFKNITSYEKITLYNNPKPVLYIKDKNIIYLFGYINYQDARLYFADNNEQTIVIIQSPVNKITENYELFNSLKSTYHFLDIVKYKTIVINYNTNKATCFVKYYQRKLESFEIGK